MSVVTDMAWVGAFLCLPGSIGRLKPGIEAWTSKIWAGCACAARPGTGSLKAREPGSQARGALCKCRPASSHQASPQTVGFPMSNFRVSDRHYAAATATNSIPKRTILHLFVLCIVHIESAKLA